MSCAFTHQIQWRRKGYWSPGGKFSSEEEAQLYAELRVNTDKDAGFRVVPLTKHGELSVEQCLVLMKCMQLSPKYWRAELIRFFEKGTKPMEGLSEQDLELLLVIGQQYPLSKLLKVNAEVMRNRLKMADARERAKEIAKAASDIVVLDANPEVMPIEQGCFVQAWVFVPNRTEEQERGRQHDIAAYLAGTSGPVAA